MIKFQMLWTVSAVCLDHVDPSRAVSADLKTPVRLLVPYSETNSSHAIVITPRIQANIRMLKLLLNVSDDFSTPSVPAPPLLIHRATISRKEQANMAVRG